MKVRIFALAKELDLDSKLLIQHCNDAGIAVKNSPLASISPAERDVVLEYLKTVDTSAGQEAAPEVAAPVREAAGDVGGKVRKIRTLGPLGKALRRGKDEEPDEVAETEPAPVEEPAAPVEEPVEAPVRRGGRSSRRHHGAGTRTRS